jgi:hypothetical protein
MGHELKLVLIKNPAASSGVLKKTLSDFTPQEAGNMTHRDLKNKSTQFKK